MSHNTKVTDIKTAELRAELEKAFPTANPDAGDPVREQFDRALDAAEQLVEVVDPDAAGTVTVTVNGHVSDDAEGKGDTIGVQVERTG